MIAYEFNSTVRDGIISIPEQYCDKILADVRVIVLPQEQVKKTNGDFTAISICTEGFKFDRDAANERR